MIGKDTRQFNLDNIILNGKERIMTPGIWCLLTRKDVPKQSEYNNEDFNKYAKILIETDSIYQNNDRSTGKDKSSGGDRYMKLISPIWKAVISNKNAKENKTPTIPKENFNPTIPMENKGAGLMNYTNNEIEQRWIDNNMKQLNERCNLIAAEEIAGNYGFHNEKQAILKLFKTKMEHLIDDPKDIEYLLQYVINLPKEITNDIEYDIKQLREKIYLVKKGRK